MVARIFNWHGTEQCSDMTMEPAPNGKIAKAGLAYTQAYNCAKDMYYPPTRRAAKKFSQPALSLLAYRSDTLGELRQRRNGGVRPDHAGREVRARALSHMAKEVSGALAVCGQQMDSGFSTRL